MPLKNVGQVSQLLAETINRVRQGPFDLRAANAIGFLAGILYCLTAICAVAGVVNVFVNSVAGLLPILNNSMMRIIAATIRNGSTSAT